MKNILKKLFDSKKSKIPEQQSKGECNEAADFETAITASGFGKFNVFLIIVCIPMCWTSIFETTTMSYVFPAAQCDLELTLEDKGLLNAITYAGTVSSAFFWGFLFDTIGRRRLLIIGFFLDGFFVLLSGFSQNLTFLMVMKFMGGCIISGPFAALNTYLSEVHSVKFRPRVPLLIGLYNALGSIYLPLLASVVLPLDFKWIFADYLVLHSWGFYLLLNASPALMSGIIFCFLPESPKFLMSMGENEEALKVFRKIYAINTGELPETYPIRKLVNEVREPKDAQMSSIREGWKQISPLFSSPFLKILTLVCSLQLFITMSQNTLRLWLPQLFQAITNYKYLNNGTSSTLCEMLSVIQPSNETHPCFVNNDNFEVYVNSMIVSATTAGAYLIAGTLVNVLGQNRLLTTVSVIAGCFTTGIYFSPNGEVATVLIAGFNSLASIGSNVVLIVVVNLFPTTLRTMTVSLVMMFGRGAAMVGNIIFPYLLKMGCGPPFFGTACLLFASSLLSLLLPKKSEHFI